MANMVDRTIECFTFYKFMGQCLRNRDPSDELIARSERAGDQALALGVMLAKEAGISDAALRAKTQLFAKQHGSRTNKNCLNVSVLVVAHGKRCKRLAENPREVLREFLR
jgi:hypothetical protein